MTPYATTPAFPSPRKKKKGAIGSKVGRSKRQPVKSSGPIIGGGVEGIGKTTSRKPPRPLTPPKRRGGVLKPKPRKLRPVRKKRTRTSRG